MGGWPGEATVYAGGEVSLGCATKFGLWICTRVTELRRKAGRCLVTGAVGGRGPGARPGAGAELGPSLPSPSKAPDAPLLPSWASVPRTPPCLCSWVSWVVGAWLSGLRHLWASTPTGLSQQQAPLRQGDLHLQEDGGGVSTPLPPPPSSPTLDSTQGGSWGGSGLDGDPLPHPFPAPTLLQLLQGDQADGAGQRPGHEHALGRDFSGKRRCGGCPNRLDPG